MTLKESGQQYIKEVVELLEQLSTEEKKDIARKLRFQMLRKKAKKLDAKQKKHPKVSMAAINRIVKEARK